MISKNWIKELTSTHEPLVRQFNIVYKQNGTLPEWLVTERTALLMKSNETAQAKNYCPIARQKITYKLFTGMINFFIIDHCTISSQPNKQEVNKEAGDVQTSYS